MMKKGDRALMKITFRCVLCLVFLSLFLTSQGFAQNIPQIAIDTVRSQAGLPPGTEIRFLEQKESPVSGFFSVKLLLVTPDREIPTVVYVDKTGEKVFLGRLIVKGENVTRKEAGEPRPRKVDPALLQIEKSPFRGPAQAKVTMVEFSSFHCIFCVRSWKRTKDLLEKYPHDIKYVFKHFPLQSNGKARELSEMVAAVQAVNNKAFWTVHDFFFSDEGQNLINRGKEELKGKIEDLLRGNGFDVKAFQAALDSGKGRTKVEEDVALGMKIGVNGTPSAVINGDFLRGLFPDKILEKYLGR
jgi:protein-disulfide isomerase